MNDIEGPRQFGVIVYTTPGCVQCDATKRALNSYGIAFAEIDLSAKPDVLDRLKADGWQRAPIVHTGDGQAWSGFRPDKIRELARPESSRATSAEPARTPASCQRNAPRL
jgi:glutaredoxin-like protein NrdH